MLKMTHAASITALSLVMCAATATYGGTLIPVLQVPNSMETDVFGVNDNNMVAGAYIDEQFVEHGFSGTLDGQYAFFDYDKGSDTLGVAVNKDGVVFGWATQRQPPGLSFQFLRYPDGTMTPTTLNGKPMKGGGRPGTITDNGRIVGSYESFKKGGEFSQSKGLYGHGTNYESKVDLHLEGIGGVFATGINNEGDLAGYYEVCPFCDSVHGFVVKDGVERQIDYPDDHVISTAIEGINDTDLMIGQATYDDFTRIAFLFDMRKNRFKRLSVDVAYGISNGGLIAVDYKGAPYIYCLHKQNCPGGGLGTVEVHDGWIPAAGSVRAAR